MLDLQVLGIIQALQIDPPKPKEDGRCYSFSRQHEYFPLLHSLAAWSQSK